MFNIFKKAEKDFLKIGIEYFRENNDFNKIYISINEFKDNIIYGELIHAEDLNYFAKNSNYEFDSNTWLFLLTFDLKDNSDIDNLYKFESLNLYKNFTEIYDGKFALEISPELSNDEINILIRNNLSKTYRFKLNKKYGILSGVYRYSKFPDLLRDKNNIVTSALIYKYRKILNLDLKLKN